MECLAIFFLCTALSITLVSLSDPLYAEQVGEKYVREQLLDNVIVIRAVGDDGIPHTGFGFIIGREGETVWAATAGHVVLPRLKDGNLTPFRTITARRHNDPREWKVGTPKPAASGGDIAFVPVLMPSSQSGIDTWLEGSIAACPQVGERAWIAGRAGEIAYDDSVAQVSGGAAGGTLSISGLDGHEGQSGAPIVITRGVIGMYVSSDGQRFISIDKVAAAVVATGATWSLHDSMIPCAYRVKVCVVNDGPVRTKLKLNGPGGIAPLEDDGCATTSAGANLVVADNAQTQCSPQRLMIGSDPLQTFHIQCATDPIGTWASQTLGYLNVVRLGEGEWKIEGLEQLPQGQIEGRLISQPPNLWIDAQTASGAKVTGNLQLFPARLWGRIYVGGTALDIDLRR